MYSCSFSHSKQTVYGSFNAILENFPRLPVMTLCSSYFKKSVCRCYYTVLRLSEVTFFLSANRAQRVSVSIVASSPVITAKQPPQQCRMKH